MKRIIKLLFKIILIIIFVGIITMIIDLVRVNNNQLPIFSINTYNSRNKKESFQGLLYTFERKIYASTNESINDSSNLKFNILFIKIKIKEKDRVEDKNINIEIKKEEECSEVKLLDFNYEKNLYSYCLEEVKINGLNINVSNLMKIEDKLEYLGFTDQSTIYGIDDLIVHKCNTEVNDYYITSKNTNIGNDLCVKRKIEKRRIR